MHTAPPRLMRMLLALLKYDLDVQFVSGKSVPIADLLSRQPMKATQEIKGLDLHIHTVLSSLFITDKRLESVKNATLLDSQLQKLKQTILDGFPKNKRL